MNIFKILSRGDGNLKEPNISALLSYLLDPKEDHELKDKFIRKLWPLINHSDEVFPDGEIDVKLEPPLHNDEKNNFCDILITFNNKAQSKKLSFPQKAIFIENKVRESLNKEQLNHQIRGVSVFAKHYLKKSTQNYLIFLTPDGKKYDEILDKTKVEGGLLLSHLYWNSNDNKKFSYSIVNVLDEIVGQTNSPIKDLILNFREFIVDEFKAFNFKKDAIKSKKNIILKNNIEDFEGKFLYSFCDTRTLEIFQFFKNHVQNVLKDSGENKKHYISNNKKGIVSYPHTNKSKSFFIRFDLSPYAIKIHLPNPSSQTKEIIKGHFPKAKLEEGKRSKNNLEFSLNTLNTSDEVIAILLDVITKTLNENTFKISDSK